MRRRTMAQTQMTLAEHDDEYRAFVEKFKPKKTTDDCYTPPEIYDVIADYVAKRYGLDRADFVRPFWPDGDYERFDYDDGCTVVDNPPFSILAKICQFYMANGIGFFLFAPTLTCLHASGMRHIMDTNHIVCKATVTYENGAKVPTSFVTNLDSDGTVLEANPELTDIINAKDEELRRKTTKSLPKYEYPDNVITAAKCNWFAAHHTPYKVNRADCCPIHKLDAMTQTIFGGGLLLSERAAAERAAAERAAAERAAAERAAAHKWQLSERERKLVEMLGKGRGEDA